MGIRAVRPGARLGDIGCAIERHARRNGYSVVREYCGHGIGREMHEDPQVRHFESRGPGLALREGMVFTIEPMLNRGRRGVRTMDDGWTCCDERRVAVRAIRAHRCRDSFRRVGADAASRRTRAWTHLSA